MTWRRVLILVLAGAAAALSGYAASRAFGAGETTGTQTFTNVVTYTIPTVTQTVTVAVGGTTTAPTTTPTAPPPPPPPPSNCTATLNPSTGDAVDTFVNNAANGTVLCLHGGDYGAAAVWTGLSRSGSSSSPLVVRSYPGETATLHGELTVDSSWLTLSNLRIDHFNTVDGLIGGDCAGYGEALILAGSNITLDHDEIFQSQRTFNGYNDKFNLYIQGSNETISHSKIHDVGGCSTFDHGVYIGHGSNTKVFQNWIWNTHFGWGVQIYPDASGTSVYSNVIDSPMSGLVTCSTGGHNEFYNNIVSGSTGGGTTGSGSLVSGCGPQSGGTASVTNNDSWQNPGGLGNCTTGRTGMTCSGNVTIDPSYANQSGHDYRVLAPALAGFGLWDGS